MNVPRYTAEFAIPGSHRAIDFASRKGMARREYTPYFGHTVEGVRPAAMDSHQQAYHDCVVDCRREGGTNCANQCTPHSGTSGGGGSTGTSPSTSGVCLVEEVTHPLGTAIMDGIVRAARDNGAITNKGECYSYADLQAGVTAAIASGFGNALGGFLGGFLGAAVGFNSYTLSHCICDRYF